MLHAKQRFGLRFDAQPSDLTRACPIIHFSMLILDCVRFHHILTVRFELHHAYVQIHILEKIYCMQPLGAVPLHPNRLKNITDTRLRPHAHPLGLCKLAIDLLCIFIHFPSLLLILCPSGFVFHPRLFSSFPFSVTIHIRTLPHCFTFSGAHFAYCRLDVFLLDDLL